MSYFPMLIKETDSGCEYIVDSPRDIPNGKTFTVLKCNVDDGPIIVNANQKEQP
jgi:hypothetical protein